MEPEQELLPNPKLDKATRLRRIMQSHEKLIVVTLEDELERERDMEEE